VVRPGGAENKDRASRWGGWRTTTEQYALCAREASHGALPVEGQQDYAKVEVPGERALGKVRK